MLGLLGDKKKLVSAIVGSKYDVKEGSVEESMPPKAKEYDEIYLGLADEIIKAVKEENKELLIGSLKAFVKYCGQSEEKSIEVEVKS